MVFGKACDTCAIPQGIRIGRRDLRNFTCGREQIHDKSARPVHDRAVVGRAIWAVSQQGADFHQFAGKGGMANLRKVTDRELTWWVVGCAGLRQAAFPPIGRYGSGEPLEVPGRSAIEFLAGGEEADGSNGCGLAVPDCAARAHGEAQGGPSVADQSAGAGWGGRHTEIKRPGQAPVLFHLRCEWLFFAEKNREIHPCNRIMKVIGICQSPQGTQKRRGMDGRIQRAVVCAQNG